MLVIRHQMRGGSVERHQKEGHVIRIYRVMLEVVEPDRYLLAVLQQSSHQSLHLQTINAFLQISSFFTLHAPLPRPALHFQWRPLGKTQQQSWRRALSESNRNISHFKAIWRVHSQSRI